MNDRVMFVIDCYSEEPFPCKRDGVSEFCLRNGRCPYACAIPSSIDKVAIYNISLAKVIWTKLLYRLDQMYCIVKWRLFPSTWKSDIDDAELKALENDPSFMTWAKVPNIEEFQFYQWLDKVHEDEKQYAVSEEEDQRG